ncbi:2OG-Fe(II) oxygenase [uncultured Jatrophihabitans sp.]|uniref:2OG-Fe(II) oxygenase n=1 Tax=uncultured Jatrophihabitans sp. TaxID=1610747 RepID=UPI0035C9CF14
MSDDVGALVAQFASSGPVKHVVIDDFLDSEYAQQLFDDLPDPKAMPKSRDYMFSDKRELSTLDRHSAISIQLHDIFMSPEFADLASKLVGHPVFLDPEYIGGGFHAGSEGSFLDLHVDFNIHPAHEDWLREFNILLYLNPGWEPSWGGELLLTDNPGNPTLAVEPRFNRLVMMECTDTSFHGYKQIAFPAGRSRRSVAAYAYSTVVAGSVTRHTTNWVPQDASLIKTALAKNWNRIVLTKNRFLGSGTLKNRR